MRGYIYKIVGLVLLVTFGRMQFSDFLASNEAKSPKQFTVDEIKGKNAEDLPRYFILKDAVIANFATVESTLQMKKSQTELSKTTIFAVYSVQEASAEKFNPAETPVSIFVKEDKTKDLIKIDGDTTLFKKPMTFEVKNDDIALGVDEISLFKEQSINVAANAFTLTKGYDTPSAWSLLFSLISFLIAGLILWSLYKSIRGLNKASDE